MPAIASSKWRMLAQRTPIEPLPKGLDAAWDVGMGLVDRVIPRRKRFLLQVERILSIEKEFSKTQPLSVVMAEKIASLRHWAKGRTVQVD